MAANLQIYKEQLEQPWGKLYYDILFAQLAHIKNKEVLDFGSGFGLVADFLAQNNQVTAIEPNDEMIAERKQNFHYHQLQGSLEMLKDIPHARFDLIVCHNVLEYVDEPALYLAEFSRLLKKGGQISLVKHNEVGRIMQTVVFANDTNLALDFLSGKSYQSHSMGQATCYEITDVLQKADTELTVQDYQGIRIFYGLQDNAVKTAAAWREKMLEIELSVCQQSPYRDIAAFQHIWLQKGDKNDSLLCK
ncbi:Ubiquinone biosynthesis O-methyltransferase [Streptococcus constellatus]|uniref:Ubiquinone biosynthesis O-methyltransferase n=1 Tax=Streptococcus constellatus TaxID=76860 RepID=A0A564SL15_STRCV|nr:class I SAM-dependent methyltransferase [Streptococcus constellatus]VUW95799.1 Ubiquinone biosynthesis O-methyltransferase [Streptococcus constellatus]VUX05635.1 Ubiquinone biosynthesis O-methyltransferase [Streptococcus gordonii]